MLADDARWIVAESVEYAELDGEAVLLEMNEGTYYGLDTVATDIWKLLVKGTTRDEILSCLHQTYDVDREQLRADVDAFMGALRDRRLVHISER